MFNVFRRSHLTLRLSRRALLCVMLAFGLGVLAFAVVLMKDRSQRDFYRPVTVQPVAVDQKFEPLPEPSLSGVGQAGPAPGPAHVEEAPSLPMDTPIAGVDDADVPSAGVPAPDAAPTALPEDIPGDGGHVATQDSDPLPLPGHSALPEYPARALRRGDSGTVRVRVEVDAAGNPTKVALAERSGSRQLDRAALDAVERWRFKPAQRNGQAVPGVVVVPIDFNLN